MYYVIGALMFLFMILYSLASYKCERKESQLADAHKEIDLYKEHIESLRKDRNQLEEKFNIAYRQAIYNAITTFQTIDDTFDYCRADELLELFHEERYFLEKTCFKNISDINSVTVEKAIKLAIASNGGYCDIFQPLYGKCFRKIINGGKKIITKKEGEMMHQNDYDFVLKEISLEDMKILFEQAKEREFEHCLSA